MNSIKRKKSTLLVCLGLVMALMLTTLVPTASMEVQAAKKVTTKKVTTNYNWRKAPTVKIGTTKVTAKRAKHSYGKEKNIVMPGFIKFKAPKAGTYQFTISNLARKGNDKGYTKIALVCPHPECKYLEIPQNVDPLTYTAGEVVFWTGAGSANSIWPDKYLKVKTKGGKSSTLCLATEIHSHEEIMKEAYLTSRTATVKLSKGQVVYMGFRNYTTNTCTLKIKKK